MASSTVPHQLPLGSALQGSETLAALLQRLRQSQARLETITPLLPQALRQAVQAGPVDDAAWSLLVDHSAAAAKLRQMLPQLQARLTEAGWPDLPIKLRVRRGAR